MSDDETPKHIEKFHKNRKIAKKIVDTLSIHHSDAYITAAKKILMGPEGKHDIDLELLEDDKIRVDFTDKMGDYYVEKATEYFKADTKDFDDMKKSQLMNAYAGITKGELLNYVREHGKDYNISKHEEIRDNLVKHVGSKLEQNVSAHLTDEHIDDLLVGIKNLDDIVDKSKLKIKDALNIYNANEIYGTISPEIMENFHDTTKQDKPLYLKKKKEDKK